MFASGRKIRLSAEEDLLSTTTTVSDDIISKLSQFARQQLFYIYYSIIN